MAEGLLQETQTWGVVFEYTDSGIPNEYLVSEHETKEAAREKAQSLNEEYGHTYEPFEGGRDVAYYVAKQLGSIIVDSLSDR